MKSGPGHKSEVGQLTTGRRSREMLLPGNHNPGDGQAVSTVNTCESAIKTVMRNEPKWLSFGISGSGQNGNVGQYAVLNETASWMAPSPVDSRHLPSHVLGKRNVETPYISRRRFGAGEWARRKVHGFSPQRYTLRGEDLPIGVRAWDVGKSERRAVMARIPAKPYRARKRANVRRVSYCERV